MEQIETQVSDLRYLTQAPVPLPADRQGHGGTGTGTSVANVVGGPAFSPHNHPNHSTHLPLSASVGDNSAHLPGGGGLSEVASLASPAAGTKRKADDDEGAGGKQQRSKRNRYISIACNECKRRKIKCNGETPCQRCGNLNLACLYAPNCCSSTFKDSEEYRRMTDQMTHLQEQVENLYQSMNTLRTETLRLASINDKILPLPSSTMAASPASSLSSHRPDIAHARPPSFRGPTSMAFSLDVANNTIHNMGYKGIGDGDDNHAPSEDANPRVPSANAGSDPLWEYSRDEIIRLCRLHEEEVGIMYPVVKIQTVMDHARNLCAAIELAKQQGETLDFEDTPTLQLKMLMCCALVVEEHGHSERAARLYDSMEAIVNRKLMADGCDFANLPLLALLAGYRFLSNDEILAWRVMGQVARLCLEWGIHQRTGLMKIHNEEERKNALNSFWTAYMLDRRWAFGTGLPYVVQDEDIDSELPMPDEYPYLIAMITYSRLCAKVWRQVAHFGPILARELRQQDMEQLDQEILQWYERVPEEVKLRNWDKEKQMTATPSYNLQRLRIWTYLRLNQIRTWLYTPILHSATSIMGNLPQAHRVVDLAKDTIRYLSHLNNTTNLYRKMQVFYHQFLTSAIAVLFLASVHAPVRFSTSCRDEFYMALELVKDLSAKSWVSQRLWRTIGSLKEVAPRIGLRHHSQDDDPHSTAALTMAGLATGGRLSTTSPTPISPFGRPSISSTTPIQTQQTTPHMEHAQSPNNGTRIQSEMSRIFEGYVAVKGFAGLEQGYNGPPSAGLPTPSSRGAPANIFTPSETTVFQHFREMF
ncbi:putative transcriptional regulatory protein like [Verticillium longisporum]|nr:putative transcriptional regulatory protein like [Verticillium longisporum]